MNRLEKLRALIASQKVDGFLITNPYNVRYMTGFTGSTGIALVTKSEALFITDFRYIEQAEREVTDFRAVQHKATLVEEIASYVRNLNIQTLGFEKEHITYAQFLLYEKFITKNLVGLADVIEKIRLIKTPEEIRIIKVACDIVDAAFEHILPQIRPGVTELEIANELEFFMRKSGATSSSFDTIVASGVRSALPHGVATDKIIEKGEFVTLDYGALYNGYVSDTTRTVAVGQPSQQLKEVYEIVLEAQLVGVKTFKPGMTGVEADAVVRDVIRSHGYGEAFGHSTGHGIGLEVHEGPGLSHRSNHRLEAGMTVTCEPGIYLPGIGGVRIEDDVLITADGNDVLTHAPKELIIL